MVKVVALRREQIKARGVATSEDVHEQLVDVDSLKASGWHYNVINGCWYSAENPLNPRVSEGSELIWCNATRQLVNQEAVENRLAQALGKWMREEIGRGFRQFYSRGSEVRVQLDSGEVTSTYHQSYGCDGYKEEGKSAGYRASFEDAARSLVENSIGGSEIYVCGIKPSTHVLIWRIEPELACYGKYERRYAAYTRFCFVKLPEGSTLLDCEEIK